MANLKCHDYSCMHNCSGCCSLDRIDVSIKANCLDYRKSVVDKTNLEVADEVRMSAKKSQTDIHCHDCQCTNNRECRCSLNNLRIDRIEETPLCVNRRYHR